MWNRKWSRGESNPRPLECDLWSGARRVITSDGKGAEDNDFTRRALVSFEQLSAGVFGQKSDSR
jgi:hypothetical protein